MNTSLLTNMLLSTSLDVLPKPSTPAEYGKNNQSSSQSKPDSVDNSICNNTPQITTPDNNSTIAQKEPVDKSPEDFHHTLGKKITTQKSQDDSVDKKSKSENINSQENNRQDSSQSASAQAVEKLGKNATIIDVETPDKSASITNKVKKTQTDQDLGKLLTNSKDGKSPSTNKESVKSTDDKPLITVAKSQLNPKNASHEKSENTQTVNNQNTNGKVETEIQTTNKTPNTLNSSNSNQSEKESTPQTTTEANKDGNKKVAADQKQAILNDNVIEKRQSPANQQKAPVDSEKPAATVKDADSKASTSQQDQNTSEILSENDKAANHTGKNQTGDTIANKLNPTQVQTSTFKNSSNSPDNNNSSNSNSEQTQAEQMPSSNSENLSTTEQITTSGLTGKTNNSASPDNSFANISQQIQEHISNSVRQGEQRVTIHLHPPELGKVSIKFQEQGEQIIGLLEVNKTQTRYEIQQALPQIIRNLADSGITIRRLEVVMADQTETQTLKDQSLQDGSFPQQGSSEGDNFGDTTANSEWMTNINSYQDFSQQQDTFVTDKSINMLV